jgi:hypothetical protein
MRINNWKHFPWIVFVCLATIAACILYAANFHPDRLPPWIHLPASWIQKPTEHHTVGGTPLGLWFGSISLGIFIFAALLSLRKKIPLWRIGTVQRWLRAHIWLTILTIPLVILHSGFRLGGGMTTFLMLLYAIVMVSGFYGLFLQHLMPRLMKERLPAETVFEQIPHIRAQLAAAAEKLSDSFKPAPPKKPDAGAAVMASTKGELSTPVARAKSVTGSSVTAAPVTAAATSAPARASEAESAPAPASIPNAAVAPAAPKAETIGTPTARVQSDLPGAPVARTEVPAGDRPAPSPPVAPAAPVISTPAPPAAKPPAPAAASKPSAPAATKPAATAPKPAAKPAAPSDPESEAVLVEFIERQILPYLQARRGDRMRLGNPRFSDDTFRFVKLRVTEGYRSRVEEIQGWCDERRMLDLQTRLQHWLHAWLFVHVPFSFFLLMLTIWHACVTLFYY